jgi:hypothetical protein
MWGTPNYLIWDDRRYDCWMGLWSNIFRNKAILWYCVSCCLILIYSFTVRNLLWWLNLWNWLNWYWLKCFIIYAGCLRNFSLMSSIFNSIECFQLDWFFHNHEIWTLSLIFKLGLWYLLIEYLAITLSSISKVGCNIWLFSVLRRFYVRFQIIRGVLRTIFLKRRCAIGISF